MTPHQYQSIKRELGWTDTRVSHVIGKDVSTVYRWLREPQLPREFAVLMRTFSKLRWKMSKSKFDEFMSEIIGE